MYRIYGDLKSGNCYKIKLLMDLLDIDHEWVYVDVLSGETQSETFKAMNRNARGLMGA